MNKQFEDYHNLYTNEERKKLIANSIVALRKGLNMTQKEGAEAIGINPTTYVGYERGKSEPTAETLVRLALLFDVSLDILMQKDNLAKDKIQTEMQIEEAEQEIKKLMKEAKSIPNQEQKETVEQLLSQFGEFAKLLKGLNRETAETTDKNE